jgi:hypothetical protein
VSEALGQEVAGFSVLLNVESSGNPAWFFRINAGFLSIKGNSKEILCYKVD